MKTILMQWNISILGRTRVFRWKPPLKLKIKKGYHSLTAQIYFGLSEHDEMSFLLKHLKSGAYFVDVGANMGAYTLLAAGICQAEVLAIEPWPENVFVLREQVEINTLGAKVEILQIGASDRDGDLLFQNDSSQNTYVVESNYPKPISGKSLPVYRLDSILKRCPQYIKIDVEGHEFQVLNGIGKYLEDPILEIIQCETLQRLDTSRLETLWQFLLTRGFEPKRYDTSTDSLKSIQMGEKANTLFVRGDGFDKWKGGIFDKSEI